MPGMWGCACGSANDEALPVCQACGRAAPVAYQTAGVATVPGPSTPPGVPIGPRGAGRPTLLPPAPAPTNGSAAPGPRRGPVFPVARSTGGGPAASRPRTVPTLNPTMGGAPSTAGPGPMSPGPATLPWDAAPSPYATYAPDAPAPRYSQGPPVAVAPPPPAPPVRSDGPGALGEPPAPPPLPPEWSEALGLVQSQRSAAPPLDRRSSAALEPPSVERERRSTVALSLAGLFDDLGTGEAPAEEAAAAPKTRKNPEPWTNDEPEQEQTAHHGAGGLKTIFSPGGLIAAIAVVAALFVVGYVVSKANPPKPPGDQVTAFTPSH